MECQNLDEATFRERFKNAFELDSTLTADDYWKILVDAEFDEDKSLWKVVDRVRKPNEFLVPDFLLRSVSRPSKPDLFTTPINKIIPPFDSAERPGTMSTSKKRPYRPREDSDDELLFPKASTKGTPNQPLISPFKGTPKIIPTRNNDNSFKDSKLDTDEDEDDDDIRPSKKRHRAQLVPVGHLKSKLRSKRNGGASPSQKASQLKPTQPSQLTSTSDSLGEEMVLFVPTSRKEGTQTSKFLTKKGLKVQQSDSLESDVDDEDDTSSEESDDVTSPVDKQNSARTPGRRGNQNEAVLKYRMPSMATPILHMLASFLLTS